VIDPLDPTAQNPLYPLPAFGAGVSMAFHRKILDEIGGFDPALGAGTPAGGSEDTAVFTQVLLHGYALVYTPDAIVRHHHRPDLAALRVQLAGYGRGLTAYYTKLVVENPRLLGELLKLAPVALHDLLAAGSLRNQPLGADFPRELAHAEVLGMLTGPVAYLKGKRAA
jgi:GT2 family glycosyltransferase